MPKRVRVALVVVLLVASVTSALAADGFVRTGDMLTGRSAFPAVSLADGSVLVVSESRLERYDPVAGTFRAAGNMAAGRGFGATATRLANGNVLIAGGSSFGSVLDTAEIWDPLTESVTPTGSMTTPRVDHVAVLLLDGRVLIAGGSFSGSPFNALDSAEVYDPATGVFTAVGPMSAPRQGHTAILLPSGRVLVAGAYDGFSPALATAELFDPLTNSFTPTGSMAEGRANHTANALPGGKVLVAGGFSAFLGAPLATAEVYDPVTGLFGATGPMGSPRAAHTGTALPDGSVLVAGGSTSFPCSSGTYTSSEVYDPVAGTFAASASMHQARLRHAAAALPSGGVLVMGGIGDFCTGPFASAEVYFTSVVDTHPPTITVPSDMTLLAQGPDGAVVFYDVTVIDDVDTAPSLLCAPPSGSLFPVGATTVECSASDSSSNTSTASFQITVVPPLELDVSIDPSGGVYPSTGLATLSGTVSCNRPMNGFLSGNLTKGSVQASYSRSFNCVPPSLKWMASVTPTSGKFTPGTAQATASISGCDSLGSCASDTAARDVRLARPQAAPSLVTITRITDTTSPMPRVGANFSFFSVPFVRKGTVPFLGFAGTSQGTVQGVYTSAGDSLKVVADSRTRIPGKSGRFFAFDSLTFDGTTVAFQGRDELFAAGLYTSRDGRLARVADGSTPVPGSAEVFGDFVGPVVGNGLVAFRGSTDFSAFFSFGVYEGDADRLARIADRQTAIPGGTGNFLFFQSPVSLDGQTVVFSAGTNEIQGIYSGSGGGLTMLVDVTTPVPGGSGNFLFFGAPVADRGSVAFVASDTSFRPGIYLRRPGGSLLRVVDTTVNVPSQATTFGSFSDPALDNGVAAFHALNSGFGEAGVYAGSGGSLTVVADLRTPVPGGQGTFTFLDAPALVDGRMAFQGADSTTTRGIYALAYGELRKVISSTDVLDGKAVGNLQFVTRSSCFFDCHGGIGTGFDGTYAAFLVDFPDGSQGIYRATLGRPFAQLTADVSAGSRELELGASFRLGAGHDGIDPAREPVSLQVGTLSAAIPPGSFTAQGNGRFLFTGTLDGVALQVLIQSASGGRYELTLDAEGADLAGTSGLVTVNIAIGDDAGATRVMAHR